MATFASPLPAVPESPQAGPPVMPGRMVQPPPGPDQGTVIADAQERMRQFLNTVQIIDGMVNDLATQHPEAAEGARGVHDAIERMLMQTIQSSSSAGSEPTSPRIVG